MSGTIYQAQQPRFVPSWSRPEDERTVQHCFKFRFSVQLFFACAICLCVTIGPFARSETTSVVKFRLQTIYDGKSDDGSWWKRFDFSTSTGNKVILQKFPFSSTERAQKELKVFLKAATKVLDRGSELSSAESVAVQRMILQFQDNDKRSSYAICWTNGSTFSQIAGIQLQEILEFEKRMKTQTFDELSKEF